MENKTKWIIVAVIAAIIVAVIILYMRWKKADGGNGNGNGNGDGFIPVYHAECYDSNSTNYALLAWPGPPGPEINLFYYDHISEVNLISPLVFGPELLVSMTSWFYDGRITIIQWQGIAYQYYDLGGT